MTALVLGSAALGCARSAGLSRVDAGFDAGFDVPSLPEVADVPGELVDPCAAASVIALNAIGLRTGRRVTYDIPDEDEARPICAALLDPGAPCAGGAGASCDRPRCRDGACALLDGGYRCRLAGEEFGPCAIVGAPCRAGLKCSPTTSNIACHTSR